MSLSGNDTIYSIVYSKFLPVQQTGRSRTEFARQTPVSCSLFASLVCSRHHCGGCFAIETNGQSEGQGMKSYNDHWITVG